MNLWLFVVMPKGFLPQPGLRAPARRGGRPGILVPVHKARRWAVHARSSSIRRWKTWSASSAAAAGGDRATPVRSSSPSADPANATRWRRSSPGCASRSPGARRGALSQCRPGRRLGGRDNYNAQYEHRTAQRRPDPAPRNGRRGRGGDAQLRSWWTSTATPRTRACRPPGDRPTIRRPEDQRGNGRRGAQRLFDRAPVSTIFNR